LPVYQQKLFQAQLRAMKEQIEVEGRANWCWGESK